MEYWFDYYKLQYDRIEQHENQRLLVTNFILAISTAIFLLGSKIENISVAHSLILSVIIILLNYLAIEFINKSRYWIKFHQKRARTILEHNDKEMLNIINTVEKIDSNQDIKRRPQLQKNIHYLLMILAVAYPFVLSDFGKILLEYINNFMI